jgi:hypothetical protein
VDGLLFHRCSIYRATVTYDSQGAGIESWGTALATDVPCNIQRMNGNMEYSVRGRVFVPTHNGYFRPGVDIQPGDKVTDQDGDSYIVRIIDEMPPAVCQIETKLELMEGWR